jgi:hypothetical protein
MSVFTLTFFVAVAATCLCSACVSSCWVLALCCSLKSNTNTNSYWSTYRQCWLMWNKTLKLRVKCWNTSSEGWVHPRLPAELRLSKWACSLITGLYIVESTIRFSSTSHVAEQIDSNINTSDFYKETARFKSQPGQWLYWLMVFCGFLSPSRQILAYCLRQDCSCYLPYSILHCYLVIVIVIVYSFHIFTWPNSATECRTCQIPKMHKQLIIQNSVQT